MPETSPVSTVGTPWMWAGFVAFVVAMLALDLGVFHRKAKEITVKDAAIWSGIWVLLALAFDGLVFLVWGYETGTAFFTGYLIEKALSVDNLFVFYLIFSAFAVPVAHQHRLLFWGVIGALMLRATMIFAGSYVLGTFHWTAIVFGALLVLAGVKVLVRPNEEPHPESGRIFRAIKKMIPTTDAPRGARLFARDGGRWKATPFFLVLLLVEVTDVVFAMDSILAIFGITSDPFIVFTSNFFAVMGLRSLYFVLASMATRFVYLQPGLALVLVFVGVKLAIAEWVKIPLLASLGGVSLLLAGSIVASLLKRKKERTRKRIPEERTT
ncbi:TerC family protein [Pendulispora albinea]|uniref:TerC family protein n=1 Tax=Pendulispora albinea TaxID=2741071 RepID=A0ABZ2LWM8_9BACT